MNRKGKTTLFGLLILMAGIGCFGIFVLGLVVHASRISGPTGTTTGTVIEYSPGRGPAGRRQADSCTYVYKVDGKAYTITNTCGGDREDDKREIIYQIASPRNAQPNRKGFFYLLGFIGFVSSGIGFFLTRKGLKMRNDD